MNSYNFDLLENRELFELINASIQKLPEKCRIVFEKKRFEELTNTEVAEELGITVKAVEANMTRALKLLKKDLSDYLPLVLIIPFL